MSFGLSNPTAVTPATPSNSGLGTACTTDYITVSILLLISSVLNLIFLLKIPMGTTAAIAATTTPVISLDTKYCGRALALSVTIAAASVCSKYLCFYT